MANLANKYRPSTFEDMTEQTLIVDILSNICKHDLVNRNFLFIGPAGCGKAQPLYSKVLTPKGYIRMGDVEVGTTVFTSKGNIAHVTDIYVQGERPIYEITLQDHTKIRVADNHLNVVYRYNEDTKKQEDFCISTTELISLFESSRFKLRMDTPSVNWEHVDVPIDPYLLGALIGDGSLSNNFGFSNTEPDIIQKVDTILRRDWNMMLKHIAGPDYSIVSVSEYNHKYTFHINLGNGDVHDISTVADMQNYLVDQGYPKFDGETILRLASNSATLVLKQYPELLNKFTVSINPAYISWSETSSLHATLKSLGLLTTSACKHIPHIYLYNDVATRQALLQGLYDTDGYTDKQGSTTFTTSSLALSSDFQFLVQSLGIRDTVITRRSRYKSTDSDHYITLDHDSYDHNLKIPNEVDYCSSIKHLSRRVMRQHSPIRNIVSIKYIGQEDCQCIMLDHEDHTYISDNFIPTHNTTIARIMGNILNDNKGEPIEIDAASHSGVDKMREIIQQAHAYPIGCAYKIFIVDECHSLSSQAWQALLKTLEESPAKSIFVFCTTNPEKIPATILSRVQTFQLSKISLNGITNRLIHVLETEVSEGRQIEYTESAVTYIAKLANGGMRDALTLLDKALSYSNQITSESLSQALGLPNYDNYFALLNAIAKKDNTSVSDIIHNVYNSGVNFVKWFEGFHSFVINIVKYIFLQDVDKTMIPSHYVDKIAKYSTAHSAICLKLANKLVKMNQELRSTNYQQEIALTYLCSSPVSRIK